ncbi:MAG: ROK family transcriptional regulator [Anaerolineales bacterium]|jgi:predicted NBD/HSP70 family sugar kinase
MNRQIGVDQSLARKYNSATILDHLRLHAPISRAGLAKYTGLTRSSVSRIIDQLQAENLVREVGTKQEKVGRPGTMIELNPSGGAAVGVEIGVDFISIILTNFIAQILWREHVSMPDESDVRTYLREAEKLIYAALQVAKAEGFQPLGIGVGVWGLVDIEKGEVRFAPNLKWRDIPLKKLWEGRFGLTVFVENDANASAMGEYYLGAAKNVDDFIYVNTGIGLGGGIISAGILFRGWNGYAGEIGHMTIDPDGEACMCGKRGCWETQVGSRVAVQSYKTRTGREVSYEDLVALVRTDDPTSLEIFLKMGLALGIGIGSLVNIFSPRCIVVGGALIQVSDRILPIARENFAKNSLFQHQKDIKIIPSELGSNSCVLGCVALVLDEVIRQRAQL